MTSNLYNMELPVSTLDTVISDVEKDRCLEALSRNYTGRKIEILPLKTCHSAIANAKKAKKLPAKVNRAAMTSGGSAAAASLSGIIPLGGGTLIGMAASYFANDYGVRRGFKLGKEDSDVNNAAQNLYHETDEFYNALGVRLLHLYLKANKYAIAKQICKEFNLPAFYSDEKTKKKAKEQQRVHKLAKGIKNNMPSFTSIVVGTQLKEKEIANSFDYLKTVCEYILTPLESQPKAFKQHELDNELKTTTNAYTAKLHKQADIHLSNLHENRLSHQEKKIEELEATNKELMQMVLEMRKEINALKKAAHSHAVSGDSSVVTCV